MGLLETNGNQNYRNLEHICSDHSILETGKEEATWTASHDGVFELDDSFG